MSNNVKPSFYPSQNVIMLLFLIFFALLSIASSATMTPTLDEYYHYQYGVSVLHGDSTRVIDSSMPVLALNALPSGIAVFLPEGAAKNVLGRFAVARLVTIIFSIVTAYLVFVWSRSLYGFVPALFSLLLYILDPNIIAHSQLTTTDLYALGIVCLVFYRLWLFANLRSLKNGLLFLLALGISQIVKYTAVVLLPLSLITLLIFDWQEMKSVAGKRALFGGRYAGYILASLVSTILIINIGFLFNRALTRFGDYEFRSAPFINLQKFAMLQKVPVPFPYPYLEGLDWMLNTEQSGNRYGNVYLLGQLSKTKGFPGYYFIASLLKVPIASQVIMAAAFLMYFFNKDKKKNFPRNEAFLIVPIIFFTIYFNFFFNAQIGIRYYLVMFPLLYVFSGSLFTGWENFSFFKKALVAALVAYLMASVLSYFPHYIPYFNEIVWDKTQTYRYLADSNLEWGQGGYYLKQYLSGHPDAVDSPAHVQPGTLVVGGSNLVGILEHPHTYAWLRDNFEPVDTIAYCYFVYKISQEEVDRLCASTDYCK